MQYEFEGLASKTHEETMSNTKLFVANIPFSLEDDGLREVFETVGTVTEVKIVKDRYTGRSRGFGFVTMDSAEATTEAQEKLNGYSVEGKELKVDAARDNREGGGGGGYKGGGGGYNGGGGGGYKGGGGGGGYNGGGGGRSSGGGGNRY